MVTLLFLTALAVICYLIYRSNEYHQLEVLAIFGLLLLVIILPFHLLSWCTTGYAYEKFVQERNAFEQTLNNARNSGNQYETAAIVKDVAEWNQQLAVYKYKNNHWFFDQYIDDRIETLEPIK